MSVEYVKDPRAVFLGQLLPAFLTLPALRGFWPFTSMGDGGAAIDLSGQGRALTNNNNALFSYGINGGVAAFAAASSQYFSRADEAGFDIGGDETYVAPAINGITMGGWFSFDTVNTTMAMMSKFATGGQASYRIYKDSDQIWFYTSTDGTAENGVLSGDAPPLVAGRSYFCVGRSPNGSDQSVFVNGVESVGSPGLFPIFNSTTAFEIGRMNGASLLSGRSSLCFLCAAAVPTEKLTAIYEQSRGFFNV